MKFSEAIDRFIADWRREGRIASERTEVSYRSRLMAHAEDVGNRDPRTVGRSDIKRTLSRWPHENTQRHAHSVLRAFYDWAMEEEIRKDNPARQVRKARPRPVSITRLTRTEVVALLDLSVRSDRRTWRAIHLGVCAGLRSQEMRGLRGAHFARVGFIHVSADIAKGGRERWVPVIADLEPVVEEILTLTGLEEHVLPGQRSAGHPVPGIMRDTTRPIGATTLYQRVVDLGIQAGIGVHVTPHSMRHLFSTYVARHGGILVAKALLGHADVSTTQRYTDAPTLDELAVSLSGFSYFPAVPQTKEPTP